MSRYIALIDGEVGAYGVSFPDCPGCVAMGATPDEALANATDALREWMGDRAAAGLPLPENRSIDTIRRDASWSDDLAASVIASVPLLLDEGRLVRANLSLDAGLLAQIDAAARERGLTRSAFLASAAREKIAAAR